MLPNLDAEPDEVTPGEKEFCFGANAPDKTGDSLLAFEDLPEHAQKAIQEKRQKQMIVIQRNNVPTEAKQTPRGVTFLKPNHLSEKGDVATILRVTADKPDNFGNPYVVTFSIGGQKYSKGFKPTSDNLATLVDLLGEDETKWNKRTVLASCVKDEEGAMRIRFAAAPKAGK